MPYSQLVFYNNLFFWLLILSTLWTIPWKGVALWKAARNSHRRWFVILLTVNTLAILDIIYIFGFSRKKASGPAGNIK